jgi:hypothetical protein
MPPMPDMPPMPLMPDMPPMPLMPDMPPMPRRVGLALGFLLGAKLANVGVPVLLKHLVDALAIAEAG